MGIEILSRNPEQLKTCPLMLWIFFSFYAAHGNFSETVGFLNPYMITWERWVCFMLLNSCHNTGFMLLSSKSYYVLYIYIYTTFRQFCKPLNHIHDEIYDIIQPKINASSLVPISQLLGCISKAPLKGIFIYSWQIQCLKISPYLLNWLRKGGNPKICWR